MAGNFRGCYFRIKSKKALKINFCGIKFRDRNQYGGVALHKCNRYMHSISLMIFFVSVEDAISWMTVATVACSILGSVGCAATMFVATSIIMDLHNLFSWMEKFRECQLNHENYKNLQPTKITRYTV